MVAEVCNIVISVFRRRIASSGSTWATQGDFISKRGEGEMEGRKEERSDCKTSAVSVRLAMVAMSGDGQQVSVAVASTTLT